MYKEYSTESGKNVDLSKLKTGFINNEEFKEIHRDTAILCADVLIWIDDGWLLIKRNILPLKGEYCTVGGRINKGSPVESFLINKAKDECNLDINNLQFIGVARTFFKTDPFDHGKGTDTTTLMHLANGRSYKIR